MWLFEIDVALVTSLRDGMNLVSYEYVACQNLRMTEGVLVLSEVRFFAIVQMRNYNICMKENSILMMDYLWCLASKSRL